MKTARNISDADRAARSARLTAQNADPAFRAKVDAGKAKIWTPERRERQREVMATQMADPAFQDKRLMGRRVAVPEHSHPIVRALFNEMNNQRAMLRDVVSRAGLGEGTMAGWHRCAPSVSNLDAALNALDLELAIVPIGSRDDRGFVKKRAYRRADKSMGRAG